MKKDRNSARKIPNFRTRQDRKSTQILPKNCLTLTKPISFTKKTSLLQSPCIYFNVYQGSDLNDLGSDLNDLSYICLEARVGSQV